MENENTYIVTQVT